MKKTVAFVWISFLIVANLIAADVPEDDFPALGVIYRMTYTNEKTFTNPVGEVDRRPVKVILKIKKSLPSGWIYATEIHRHHIDHPSDPTLLISEDEEGASAWYNLQAFASAVKLKKTEEFRKPPERQNSEAAKP